MTQPKGAYVRTGYIVDTASIAKAIQANAQYQASLKTAQGQTTAAASAALTQLQGERAVLERLSLVAADIEQRRGLDKLAKDAANGVISTQQLARELRNISATKAEIDAVGNSIARLQDAAARDTGGGGLKTGFGTLRAAGSAFANLGGGQGVTQIASLVGLTVQMGAIGAVAGVAAIAMHALNQETERITAVTKARLTVEVDLRRQLEDATRQDATRLRNEAQDALTRAQENLSEAQNARVTLTADALLGLFTRNLVGGGAMKANQEATVAAEAAIVAATTSLDYWNGVINDNATAVNDAAAAMEKRTQFQLDIAERALKADSMTREEREKQIQENQRQIEILGDLQRQSGTTSDAFNALQNQIIELKYNTDSLREVITSTADLLDREKQIRDNAQETLQQLNDAMQREGEAREALAEISRRMAELDTETAAKRQSAQADAEERRNEIIADGAERRQEIDQQDADRREEILNQFNRSYDDALGNRDALAVAKAKEQRDDELQKQDKANKRQLDQLDKQLDKQLRAVDKALEKQLRSIEDAYQKQQRTLQQSYDRARADLENALQAQRTLQAAYNSMIHNAEVMHQAAMYKTIYDYGEMARIAVENAFRSIANTIRGAMNGVVGGPDSGIYPGASVGGNLLGTTQQERDRQAAIAQAYRDYYLRQGMPAQGFSANRMPIFPRASSPGSRNLSGAPARGSLPNVNVTVNVPLFDRASIDKLWPPLRAKLLDEMR